MGRANVRLVDASLAGIHLHQPSANRVPASVNRAGYAQLILRWLFFDSIDHDNLNWDL